MAEVIFSIIIPVYNDHRIVHCLRSIQALNYDLNLIEVVVVDNNSRIRIAEIVKPFLDSLPLRLAVESTRGSYSSRNTGIRLARGQMIALTDSDCTVDVNWLREAEHTLRDESVMGVMGFANGANANRIAEYEQRMYEEIIHAFTTLNGPLERIDTRNFVMRRTLYDLLGGFNEKLEYGGDMEFGARAHARHLCLVYNPNLRVTHSNPTQLRPLLRKRIRQNEGNMKIREQHDQAFIKRYFPHLLRYQRGLGALLWWLWFSVIRWLFFPAAGFVLTLLPRSSGFILYKALTVCAVRLGQLNYLRKKQ